MTEQNEDLLLTHEEDRPAAVSRVPSFPLTREATSKIASEMHRWGRMTGAFSIVVIVIRLVLGAAMSPSPIPGAPTPASPSPAAVAIQSGLLWPGVVLAILAAVGLLGGFTFDYLAGHKR
jgi:hypothetical protein